MIKKVAAFIQAHHMIQAGDHVIAGVSGGADSVCLFLALREFRHTMGFSMSVVHIEHGIRGEDSLSDMHFTEQLCKKYEVPFVCRSYPVEKIAEEQGISIEEAGRNVRYEAFEQEAECYKEAALARGGTVKTAVAHHGDDNAETMLFHLCRGSGIEGLAGIRPVRGSVIRPLLCVTRKEIEAFLKEKGQAYRTDATNRDTKYSRNRIRENIMPQLLRLNEASVEHMNLLAEEMLEISEYLRHKADRILEVYTKQSEDGTVCFLTEGLMNQPFFLQGRVMLELLAAVSKSRKDISREHIKALLKLAAGETGRKISLPYGVTAEKNYDVVYFYVKGREETPGDLPEIPVENFPDQVDFSTGSLQFRILENPKKDAEIPKNLYTKWFDYDKIKNRLYLRTRKPGDYFVMDRQGRRQKLRDYWINEKTPKQKRERTLLLADGSHILWVIGGRISEYYKVTEHTKRILEVRYREEKRYE